MRNSVRQKSSGAQAKGGAYTAGAVALKTTEEEEKEIRRDRAREAGGRTLSKPG